MREGQREMENEMFDALVARLKVLPASDPRARAAILARVRGRRQSPLRATIIGAWQRSAVHLATAAGITALIGLGYGARVIVEPSPAGDVAATTDVRTAPVVAVSNDASVERRVPTTFVLKAPAANRVAIIGDFNGWNPSATLLADPSKSGVWDVTVPLAPGRHTYVFLVNDSIPVVDPRMPHETDPDFGTLSSVILVAEKR